MKGWTRNEQVKDKKVQQLVRGWNGKVARKQWRFYGGPRLPRHFLSPFVGPHFSRKVENFEVSIYRLLQILAN